MSVAQCSSFVSVGMRLPPSNSYLLGCHTKVAIAPMKTKRQAAFHNATAAAGTCINCHKAENAKGKLTPVKCLGCHKKENI